jgi:hypothetical protein
MLILFVIVIWTSPVEGIVINEQEEGTFKGVDIQIGRLSPKKKIAFL